MKKRYRLLLSFMFLGSVMALTSSLEAGRDKLPSNSGDSSSGTLKRTSFALRSVRRQTRRQAPQQPQNQNVTPTATPPPPTVTVPRGEERAQTTQQSPGQNTTTVPNRGAPFTSSAPSSENATNSQEAGNNSSNQSEQQAVPQSQEQQTPPTSDFTVLTDLLEQLKQAHPVSTDPDAPAVPLTELLQQLSNPSNAAHDGVAVNNNQTQAPNNPSSMSVQQGIALAQGLNVVLDGTDRPSPENREIVEDVAHSVLADLNAIYHYEGDGLVGVTSHFGHTLFGWLQSHPFANFRKESDKEAMRGFVQKFLMKFKENADFRRDCEALEADFTQEQADYPSNCARACMLIVSLFLHPEAV